MHETKVRNALFEAFVFRYGVLVRFEMVSTCDIVACVCLIAVLICQTVVLSCYRVVEVVEEAPPYLYVKRYLAYFRA